MLRVVVSMILKAVWIVFGGFVNVGAQQKSLCVEFEVQFLVRKRFCMVKTHSEEHFLFRRPVY